MFENNYTFVVIVIIIVITFYIVVNSKESFSNELISFQYHFVSVFRLILSEFL